MEDIRIKDAIKRLEKALKYGDDMQSSKKVCVEDAVSVLQTYLTMNKLFSK